MVALNRDAERRKKLDIAAIICWGCWKSKNLITFEKMQTPTVKIWTVAAKLAHELDGEMQILETLDQRSDNLVVIGSRLKCTLQVVSIFFIPNVEC
ncbi:hypothetical protein S83_054152 [Arachis hypogaea]